MKKQQTITTLQETLEGVMQEWINTKQELAEVRIELEDTQEALRRNRNQLDSYKMFEQEVIIWKMLYDNNESFLKSAESTIRMYENMNPSEIGFPETYINYEKLKTDEMILWLVENKHITFPTNAK